MELLYGKPQVKLWFYPEHNYLRINWKGKIAKSDYVEALEFCMQQSNAKNTSKILVDQREILPLTPDEQTWLVRSWFPRFLDPIEGKAHIGIISSQMTFRDLSSKSIAKRLLDKYHKLSIRYFTEENPALKFIENPEAFI
jgi:hypothetical protein